MACRRFLSDRNGNVGIILALALVPLVGIAGLAMDYARALNEQARIQTMSDSTALAMAHRSPTLSQDALRLEAEAFFKAGMPDFVPRSADWLKIDRNNERLNLSVTSGIDTTLLKVIGIDTMDVGVSSQISWGLTKVEVALVLDITDSMNQAGKLTAMKTAAKNFVDILEAVNQNGSVKIGLVPYDMQVRLDADKHRHDDWLDFGQDAAARIKNDYARAIAEKIVETFRTEWKGCVGDRSKPYDTDDSFLTGNKVPARPCAYAHTDASNIRGLSENFAALRNQIDDLEADGMTNIPIGMVWGMSLLSNNGPIKSAAEPAKDLQKAIVLLTDGDNTRDGLGSTRTQIDNRLRDLCRIAHERSYTVYSILVIQGSEEILKGCAAKKGVPTPGNFRRVEDAAELTPVFQQIASELSDLRISK